jgi:hypothetical protein
MLSSQAYPRGVIPKPQVQLLDSVGPMPSGRYYVAFYCDMDKWKMDSIGPSNSLEGNGSMGIFGNMNRSGIDRMSDVASFDSPTTWNTIRILNVPLTEYNPSVAIMMSRDGKDFYQVAVAPAVQVTSFRDEMKTSGSVDPNNGNYVMTISNPSSRLRGDIIGQVQFSLDAERVPPKEMTLDDYFDPMNPGSFGTPAYPRMGTRVVGSSIPGAETPTIAKQNGVIGTMTEGYPAIPHFFDAPVYDPYPVDVFVDRQTYVWPTDKIMGPPAVNTLLRQEPTQQSSVFPKIFWTSIGVAGSLLMLNALTK